MLASADRAVLDPVMGDNGKLYIPEDEVPEYKGLLREADLILPNQFEAECVLTPTRQHMRQVLTHPACRTLSETPIHDLDSLATAIQVLHTTYRVPHVIITSLRLTADNQIPSSRPVTQPHTPSTESADPLSSSTPLQNKSTTAVPEKEDVVENLTIIGSTATSDFKPRLFRIDTPALPLFFSGTGDMFAALTVPRLIEAVAQAPSEQNLSSTPSWRSPDDVDAADLPLARAAQKVLASMQSILGKTAESCRVKMDEYDARVARGGGEQLENNRHLALMNASEVVVPRHVSDLLNPPDVERFRPRAVRARAAASSP